MTPKMSIKIIGITRPDGSYSVTVLDSVTGRLIPNIVAIEFPVITAEKTVFQPEVKLTLLVDHLDLDLGVSKVQEGKITHENEKGISVQILDELKAINKALAEVLERLKSLQIAVAQVAERQRIARSA